MTESGMLEIKEYFSCENRQIYLKQIESYDWSAAKFLAKIIKEKRFEQTLGGWAKLFLLIENDTLVSFVTFSAQDCIADPDMTPWLVFFHTAPEYRGRRLGKVLIDSVCEFARNEGFSVVYLASDHLNLYEKYGFAYTENRTDVWGEDSRIYVKSV